MPHKPKQIVSVVSLACGLTAAPGLAQQEAAPESVLSAWAEVWNDTIDELSGELATDLGEKIPEDKRRAFIDDLVDLIHHEVGWEAMGKRETEQILRDICGSALLQEVAPHFPDSTRTMPDELRKRYDACFGDAQFYVKTTPAYALLKVGYDNLPALYRKHGIDPTGL